MPMEKQNTLAESTNRSFEPSRIRGKSCASISMDALAPSPVSHASVSQPPRKPDVCASFRLACCVKQRETANSRDAWVPRNNTAHSPASRAGVALRPYSSTRWVNDQQQYATKLQYTRKFRMSKAFSLLTFLGRKSSSCGMVGGWLGSGAPAARKPKLNPRPPRWSTPVSCSSKYSRNTWGSYRLARSSSSTMFSGAVILQRSCAPCYS
mmetsp:Transcript_13427/g.31574  ORF Transcript_13427/g.31574 Transcript_13427/m.31574 type:complete len:209 (+) Transcript_13427:641-1267(+)